MDLIATGSGDPYIILLRFILINVNSNMITIIGIKTQSLISLSIRISIYNLN